MSADADASGCELAGPLWPGRAGPVPSVNICESKISLLLYPGGVERR